jgi:hypothetical protein
MGLGNIGGIFRGKGIKMLPCTRWGANLSKHILIFLMYLPHIGFAAFQRYKILSYICKDKRKK